METEIAIRCFASQDSTPGSQDQMRTLLPPCLWSFWNGLAIVVIWSDSCTCWEGRVCSEIPACHVNTALLTLVCPCAYTRRCTAPELRRVGFAQFAMHCELVDRNCLMDSEDSIIFELYHHFLTVSEGLIFQKRTVAISNCSLQNIEHMVSNCQLLRIAGTTL